jgi:hypothetical protein
VNECTTDICDPDDGCQHIAVDDGTLCLDGGGICQDGECVCVDPPTCAADAECCGGVCTCGGNADAGHCQTTFFQGFESDTAGWSGVTRVPSGAGGIPSEAGAFHAEAATGDFVAFTRWGGYSHIFPPSGYSTAVSIYLDMTPGVADDTRFDWTSAINGTDCNHRRDFVFNAGYYDIDDSTGAGPRYVISASNNAGRANSFPKNPGRDPFTVYAEGWYTFEHQFTNVAGTLAVILTLSGPGGTHSWTLSDPTDIIGSTVGGNRYGGFAPNEFPFLAIDDSSRS